MTPPSPRPAPSHVPTLTEVIELPSDLPVVDAAALEPGPATSLQPVVAPQVVTPPALAEPAAQSIIADVVPVAPTPITAAAVLAPTALPATPLPVAPSPALMPPALPPRASLGVDEAAMAQRVLTEVQRQIDGMLEYRLREALTPILARTSEALVRELRQELSKTMRDVVSRAVAQEVARQRTRP